MVYLKCNPENFRLVGAKVFTVQRHRMSGNKGRRVPEESEVVSQQLL